MRELERLAGQHAIIKEVRGKGLLIGMEFAKITEHSTVTSDLVYHKLLERGFLVGYTPAVNFFRFSPALTIDEKEIAQLVENLDHILATSR